MRTTQLIELLKVISEEELRGFNAFLKNKPIKIQRAVVPLFDYLKKFAPSYQSEKLVRQTVYKKVYKIEPINNKHLNKVAFQLKSLLEDFLIAYDITQNSSLRNKLLLQVLEKRNHPDFAKVSKKLITKTSRKEKGASTATDYLDLFQVNYALWSNINTRKTAINFSLLRTASIDLDTFYLLRKLSISLEEKTSKSIIALDKTLPKALDVSVCLNQALPLMNHHSIQLFSKAIQMVDSSEKSDYQAVKKILLETIHQLTKKDAQDVFVTLTNFYNKHKGENPSFWKKEAFQLYAFAHANELLIDNGRMRYIEYCNAAIAGIITNNFAWSKTFIKDNKQFLAPEISDLIHTYILAFYYFQKQDFKQVIELLQSIDLMDSFTYNLDINIQTLNLRVFFERWVAKDYTPPEEQNWLLNQINKFENYIVGHQKLSSIKKENYTQFASFFRVLVNAIEGKMPQVNALKQIQNELISTNSVALREWLENILNRLITNLSHQ